MELEVYLRNKLVGFATRLVGGGSPKCDHCGTVQGFRAPHDLKRTLTFCFVMRHNGNQLQDHMGIMKWDSHDESLEASVGRMNLRKMDCDFSQAQVQYLLR